MRIGRYEILGQIGMGALADVYRAYDPKLDRAVALKLIRTPIQTDEQVPASFRRHVQAVSILDHPHIIKVYDYGEVKGGVYIVSAYYSNGTLAQLLEARPRLTPSEAVALLIPIAEALDYAHLRGFVHGDFKPANILLDAHMRPVLTDLGLAQTFSESGLSWSGYLLGTPAYMAPEQLLGQGATNKSDIYSLGVVLYEMLSGRRLFEGNPISVGYQHIHQTPPRFIGLNAEVSTALEAVVQRALVKTPEERFESAGAMAQAMRRALGEEPMVLPKPVVVPPRPVIGSIPTVLSLLLLIGVLVLSLMSISSNKSDILTETVQALLPPTSTPSLTSTRTPTTTPSLTPTRTPTTTPSPELTPLDTSTLLPTSTQLPAASPVASPSPTPDLVMLLQEQIDKLPQGGLIFSAPIAMTVGVGQRVEARIIQETTDQLIEETIQELEALGEPTLDTIPITTLMRVRLHSASPDTFSIKALNEEEQILVGNENSWSWEVTPAKPGIHRLYLQVSIVLSNPADNSQTPHDFPVQEKEVAVTINAMYSLQSFIGNNWQFLVGSCITLLMGWIGKDFFAARLLGRRRLSRVQVVAIVEAAREADAVPQLINQDLSGLDLSNLDFRGVDLRRVNLSGSNLKGTLLYGADLTNAELVGADLRHADLEGAKLLNVDLTNAKIGDANFLRASYNDTTKWPNNSVPPGATKIRQLGRRPRRL